MAISIVHTTSANSTTVTIPSTTAGNCLVVCVASFNASTATASISGITLGGSAGNFAQAVTPGHGSNGFTATADAFIWCDPNCAGGQTSIVISGSNLNVASGAGGVIVYEVSGLVSSSVVDKSSSSGAGSGTTWTSGTTPTTTQASEIWVGVASATSPTGPSSPWANTSAGTGAIAGEQIVSSTGTATYSGTQTNGPYAAAVVTLLGAASASVSGTVQPLATVPVPRRRPARALWQRVTGQAFVKVPAPVQEYRTPPRRRPLRALVQFAPVTTTNAPPPPSPPGTVQPESTLPPARRKPARGISRGVAVPGIRGQAPAQEYRTPPRRRLSRALVRFTPVATINAPRNLLVSIAAQAGTDDYGTAFPQGILATAGVIEGPTLVGSDAFFYSSKTLGGLTQSITAADGTDAYGNAYIAGTATYANNGTFWSAIVVNSGVVNWYMATGPGGPWTSEAGIGFSWNNITGGGLNFTGPAGNGMTGDLNVTGNVTVSATLTVNGTNIGSKISNIISALSGASTTTNGLTDGTINGTSGAASAGTAHTHGAGSYAVTNGQHHHVLPTVP